jgi:hypothetical protein
MFTYSDNTNYNLNFYYFIVSIYLRFCLFGNYSYVSDVSDMMEFRILSIAPITAPSFDETSKIWAIVAVVDTRSLAGTRNHCEGSVVSLMLCQFLCTENGLIMLVSLMFCQSFSALKMGSLCHRHQDDSARHHVDGGRKKTTKEDLAEQCERLDWPPYSTAPPVSWAEIRVGPSLVMSISCHSTPMMSSHTITM